MRIRSGLVYYINKYQLRSQAPLELDFIILAQSGTRERRQYVSPICMSLLRPRLGGWTEPRAVFQISDDVFVNVWGPRELP